MIPRSVVLLAAALVAGPSVCADQGFFLAIGGINGETADGHKLEGQFGTIYRSTDGKDWTEVFKGGPVQGDFNHARNNLLRCATYGAGKFVVTGNPKAVIVSDDGINWRVVEALSGAMSVEHGNGLFLAPGATGFMVSKDGLTWTTRRPDVEFKIWGNDGAGHVRKTVFGNGVFVCLGEQRLGVTKDGETWLHHEIFSAKQRPGRQVLLFGNGRFVWLTENAGPKASTDGINWQPITTFRGLPAKAKFGSCGVFDGQKFVVSPGGGAVYHSTDGVTWVKELEDARMTSFCTAGNGLLLQNNGWNRSFVVSGDGGKTSNQIKADIPSRRVYFFDGERIVGQSGG